MLECTASRIIAVRAEYQQLVMYCNDRDNKRVRYRGRSTAEGEERRKVYGYRLAKEARDIDKQDKEPTNQLIVYLSPLRRRASWMSLGWMVTRLAWMACRVVVTGHVISMGAFRETRQTNSSLAYSQVGVFEERDKVSLSRLLEGHDGR